MKLKLRATRRVLIHKTAMTVTEERHYRLCPMPTACLHKDPAQDYFAWIGKRQNSEPHIRGIKNFIKHHEANGFDIEWYSGE